MNMTRSFWCGTIAVFLISALFALSACARPDAYVEVEIRDIERYQAAVQWVNAQSGELPWIQRSPPTCVEVSEEIVRVSLASFVYSIAIEDYDTEGISGNYDPARLNIVDDSLAAIDQRRQVDTLATGSYKSPRLEKLGDASCPYMMFFSTPYENILLAEVLPKKYKSSDDYRSLAAYAMGYTYMFIFNDQGEIEDVKVGTINYN